MPLGIAMIWTDAQIHNSDECYARWNFIFGTNNKSGSFIIQRKFCSVAVAAFRKRTSPTEKYLPSTFSTAEESTVSMYQPSNLTLECNYIEITQSGLDIMIRRFD